MEHSCEMISKLDQQFQRRFLKNCLKNSISFPWQHEFLVESNSVNNLKEDHARNIPAMFGPNCPAVWEEKMFKENVDNALHTTDTGPP